MSEIATIIAEPRERVGKGTARALRRAGRIPAVIYGAKEDPLPISVELREISREIQRPGFFTRLYDVKVNGESERVLPRDVQLDPITDTPIHIDFLRYVSGTKVNVFVAVTFVDHDESVGLRRGGVLNVVRHEIELVCKVETIPEEIELSIAGLDIGDSIHVSGITLPEGTSPAIADRDFTIATVVAPSIMKGVPEPEEEEEVEAEEEAEVEGEVPAEEEAKTEAESKDEE